MENVRFTNAGDIQMGASPVTVIDSSRVLQNVTANASIITAGTLSTARLPAAALNYQQSTDDRDMKPNTSGIHNVQAIKPFFSSFGGMTGSANTTYVDVIATVSYTHLKLPTILLV